MGVHSNKKLILEKKILNGNINGGTQEQKNHHFSSPLIKNSYTILSFQLCRKII